MKHLQFLSTSLLVSVGLLAGCAEEQAPEGDELMDESAVDGEAGKSDASNDTFTYYSVQRDARKCLFPLCGGYHLQRVNRDYTRCADGSWQESCYVAELDWEPTGINGDDANGFLQNAERLLLRGDFTSVDIFDFENQASLQISEAWFGAGDGEAVGLFTKVRDTGIRCITAPCPNTIREGKLNSFLAANLSELWLDDTGVSQEEIDDAQAKIYGDDGLIVSGFRYWFWQRGWNKGRYVTQFFERIQASKTTACVAGGCSGQYCSDAAEDPIISTCEWKPEYACYQSAVCEVQPSGTCGWTQTEESQDCFDSTLIP